ncbi:MAG: hypothetical protein KH452_11740 [Clostridiales bacterium]|nr:hypothetical protein [Clostridiales bacterium]
MKRFWTILCVTMGTVLLTGCGGTDNTEVPEAKPVETEVVHQEEEEPQEPQGEQTGEPVSELPVWESGCEEVLFGPCSLRKPVKGVFEFCFAPGYEEETWYYDEFFHIERYVDGTWKEVPISGGFCGVTGYEEITRERSNILEVNWSHLYGTLEPGIYALVKNVFPQKGDGPDVEAGVPVGAVFELKDDPGLSLLVWEEHPAGLSMEFVLYSDEEDEEKELQYGSWYRVDRLEEGRWIPVECIAEANWTMEAYTITADDPRQTEVVWKWIYGELAPGQYRFCKEVMEYFAPGEYETYMYTAEFVLE